MALLLWLMRQLEQYDRYDREPDGDAPLRARRRRALCAAARTVAARVDDEPG